MYLFMSLSGKSECFYVVLEDNYILVKTAQVIFLH